MMKVMSNALMAASLIRLSSGYFHKLSWKGSGESAEDCCEQPVHCDRSKCLNVFESFTHQAATDLEMLHQEEDVLAGHQALTLGLQQQSQGVLSVRQHHNHWRAADISRIETAADQQWTPGSVCRYMSLFLPLATVEMYLIFR